MKSEIKTHVAIMLTVTALVMGIYIGYVTEHNSGGALNQQDGISNNKLDAIWDLVDRHYVDPIVGDSVMDKVYAAILSTLDPHSNYLSQKMLLKSQESLRGNFEGVGVMIRMINDTVCVTNVIPGGPSERAGLMPGDRIIRVDGVTVAGVGMISDSVVSHLRGRRRSTAEIDVMRLSDNKRHTIKVRRDVINTPSLTYSGMLNNKTGYIALGRFSETTYDEFRDALLDLKAKGMKELVLDLRGNGGGLLSTAIDICDELLPRREMIVYTEGFHERRKEVHSTPGGLFCEGRLIVMIDEYSASASEIVAGAIQDNDRGIIAGRRSFGKGLVQQQFELPDKSAVLLTISRYYTPSGRSIQRPYDKGTDEYYNDFLQQIMNEYEGDSLLAHISDSTPYHTAKGRTVYGGGGILPDHIIHYKTDPNVSYYNQLLGKAIFADYALDYVSHNGPSIKASYPTEKDFVDKFKVSDIMLTTIINNAEQKGIARNDKSITAYKKEMMARLKAEIGEMLYSSSTFFAIMLPFDTELQEAMNNK